jgi:tRNA N6-adenosine threonylcarbamoyltransferase
VATGTILAIDTATSTAVVALGDDGGRRVAEQVWQAGYRHGEELLGRIDALLTGRSLAPGAIGAIVVGTGPGAFTGLRVGLATAKGLAHGLGRPLVGVSTGAALLAAAAASGARAPLALLLPAGPSDRVLVREGSVLLLPGGREPELAPGTTIVAVDLEGRAPVDAVAAGRRALAGLGTALLRLGADRLAAGDVEDIGRVVPEYVTLPRGIREQTGEVEWSRDPR